MAKPTTTLTAVIALTTRPDRVWDVAWSSSDGVANGSRTLTNPLDALVWIEARRRDLKAAGYVVSICKSD